MKKKGFPKTLRMHKIEISSVVIYLSQLFETLDPFAVVHHDNFKFDQGFDPFNTDITSAQPPSCNFSGGLTGIYHHVCGVPNASNFLEIKQRRDQYCL